MSSVLKDGAVVGLTAISRRLDKSVWVTVRLINAGKIKVERVGRTVTTTEEELQRAKAAF